MAAATRIVTPKDTTASRTRGRKAKAPCRAHRRAHRHRLQRDPLLNEADVLMRTAVTLAEKLARQGDLEAHEIKALETLRQTLRQMSAYNREYGRTVHLIKLLAVLRNLPRRLRAYLNARMRPRNRYAAQASAWFS